MKTITLNKLKRLTPAQCVELATFLFPQYPWKYEECGENPWDGHDVLVRNSDESIKVSLQIDYREQVNQQWARIKFHDEEGNSHPVKFFKVLTYFNK